MPVHQILFLATALAAADIVIVATLLPNYTVDYIRQLMRYAPQGSLKVLCPQGYLRDITPEGLVVPRAFHEAVALLPLFDLTIYSEEDTPNALQLAKIWSADSGAIIVTQGDKGASIVERQQITQIPTTPIPAEEIIDSVGCGDVFDAAVAHNYYLLPDLEMAVRAAHRATAKKLRATTDTVAL
jgi:sugar/nucleoside kinase (ribokinase family)